MHYMQAPTLCYSKQHMFNYDLYCSPRNLSACNQGAYVDYVADVVDQLLINFI